MVTSQLFMTPACDVNWTLGGSDEPDAAAAFAVCVSLLLSWVILLISKRSSVPLHTMKAYRGSRGIARPILNVYSR